MPADLAVIGLGPTGLPLAQAATDAGLRVIGYDQDAGAVAGIGAGRPGPDDLTAADVRRILARGFRATTDPDALGGVRTAVICAAGPPGAEDTADLPALTACAGVLAARLRPHTTVIVESTGRPGTTEDVLRPVLEGGSGLRAGQDFHLACAPSRIDPGNRRYGMANTPRVVAGLTPACTEAAAAFYARLTERVVRARGPREAEAAGLLEAAYRQINTALANELAVYCHQAGIDVWDVIRCAETRPFGFQPFRPGPGTGCRGGDPDPAHPAGAPGGPGTAPGAPAAPGPSGAAGHPLRIARLAQEINAGMPRYVVQRCAALLNEHGKAVRGARVLLLGVAARPGAAGAADDPAAAIGMRLARLGAALGYHDPYTARWQVGDRPVPRADALWDAVADADLTVLLHHHRTYDLQGLAVKAQLLLDTRGATPAGAAARL